jgi:hypothetical protein
VPAIRGQSNPANRIHPTSQKLLEFYPEPNAAGTENNYLSHQDRVIDRKQYTQRIDFVQSSKSNWMSRYSWSHDDEVTPALMLNGSKLLNTVHQVMIGNTYTLSPTLLNEARFGFNSFFNTFGRELAFVRDVVSELNIPGVSANPEEAWGIPSIGISGYSGFGDNTEGPYTNRNKVFEFTDNLSWIHGEHSFKVGGAIRIDHYNQDREPVRPRFVRVRRTGDGIGHGRSNGRPRRVRRFSARIHAQRRIGGGACQDKLPRHQPGVLLHRQLAHARQHDGGPGYPLRVHSALARQERDVDQRVPAVKGHRWAGRRPVTPSGAGAHRQRRFLRRFTNQVCA